MALTLAEGAKLSTDILKVGVIENIIKESPILSRLPSHTRSEEQEGTGA